MARTINMVIATTYTIQTAIFRTLARLRKTRATRCGTSPPPWQSAAVLLPGQGCLAVLVLELRGVVRALRFQGVIALGLSRQPLNWLPAFTFRAQC